MEFIVKVVKLKKCNVLILRPCLDCQGHISPRAAPGLCRHFAKAMQDFFDCKYYSTARSSSLEITFYGIAEKTVAASIFFEMAYNLIADWVSSCKGIGKRNSYYLGVSDELSSMVRKEKAAEEVKAKKADTDVVASKAKEEEAERQAQLDRLASFPRYPNEPYPLELTKRRCRTLRLKVDPPIMTPAVPSLLFFVTRHVPEFTSSPTTPLSFPPE